MKHAISARWLPILSHHHSHFTHIFGAHVNILLFIVKVKSLVDIRWSLRYPQLCWLLHLEWFNVFWAHSPISLKHMMPFWCLFLHPHHSNVAVQLVKWPRKTCLPYIGNTKQSKLEWNRKQFIHSPIAKWWQAVKPQAIHNQLYGRSLFQWHPHWIHEFKSYEDKASD